ncbi:MAG: hypothetical protein HY537_16575 [Deltaproteobacteria bacterium]|nr:hypothetical protein [Deltaproteobacteria bacterium]
MGLFSFATRITVAVAILSCFSIALKAEQKSHGGRSEAAGTEQGTDYRQKIQSLENQVSVLRSQVEELRSGWTCQAHCIYKDGDSMRAHAIKSNLPTFEQAWDMLTFKCLAKQKDTSSVPFLAVRATDAREIESKLKNELKVAQLSSENRFMSPQNAVEDEQKGIFKKETTFFIIPKHLNKHFCSKEKTY